MKSKKISLIIILILSNFCFAQKNFSDSPLNAVFETSDTKIFWNAFDKINNSKENPFKDYVEKGSAGVKGFTQFRIISADSLFTMVKRRKADYEATRQVLDGISTKEKRVRAIYSALKYWYSNSKFPAVYFVYGRFNSGGTVSDDGIIIGTEKLNNLDGVTGLIAHELIHYQQNLKGKESLLKQSLLEGGADFIGEFISGEPMNVSVYNYAEKNKEKLYKEFVSRLKQNDNNDWLYGTTKKDDRPNDLGYWIGYKIIEAYFNKQTDKHKAINDILNIQNPLLFLKESGFLSKEIEEFQKSKKLSVDSFFIES